MGWLSGWLYRKSITLSRASGAVTNYQMKLLVGESAGATGEDVDCNSHVQTDFDDLRFTTSDGQTLLDYWIESITGTTPNQLATVWIEFDSIGTGATTFYMYYGNAAAPAYSNGANTFIVFDDFERGVDGDAIGGSWTVVQGAVQISTDHAYGGTRCGKFLGGATAPSAYIPVTKSDNIAIRCRFWKEQTPIVDVYHGDGINLIAFEYDASENILYYNGVSWIDTLSNMTANQWELPEYKDFVWATPTVDIYHNDALVTNNADVSFLSALYPNQVRFYMEATAGNDIYIDNFIVRNFRTTEPAWGSWGSEEIGAFFSGKFLIPKRSVFPIPKMKEV